MYSTKVKNLRSCPSTPHLCLLWYVIGWPLPFSFTNTNAFVKKPVLQYRHPDVNVIFFKLWSCNIKCSVMTKVPTDYPWLWKQLPSGMCRCVARYREWKQTCMMWMHMGEVKVQLGSFLTSALDTGWRSASCPDHFTSWGSAPTTNWRGGWVGPRANPNTLKKRKIFCHCQVSPSHYTKYAIPATMVDKNQH